MMKDRDLLPIALLMFSASFAAWIGIAGPLDLKNWQTLMTGCLAIVAAMIAYQGAIAKVRHDEREADRNTARRKMGQLLKADLVFRDLFERARSLDAQIMFMAVAPESKKLSASDFAIQFPNELEYAWENLDVFPQRVLFEIRNVTLNLRQLSGYVAQAERHGEISVPPMNKAPLVFELMTVPLRGISEASAVILSEISEEVRRIAPELPRDERYELIYGPAMPPDDEFDSTH